MIRRGTIGVVLFTVVLSSGFARAGNVDVRSQVRHEINGLPNTTIFDWIEANLGPDGSVVLRGDVTRPSTKDDAEFRIRKIESVSKVVNEIHVLPLSGFDNDIRVGVYRSLFNWNSSLFRYALGANPTIHIIVENGRVTLKGVVANAMDRQLAGIAANGVFGVLSVDNQLQLESER